MTQTWGNDGLGGELFESSDEEPDDITPEQVLAIEDGSVSESEDVPTTQPEQTAEYDPYADRVGSDLDGSGDEQVGVVPAPDSQVIHTEPPEDGASQKLSPPHHDISGSDVAAMEEIFESKSAPAAEPLDSKGPDKSVQDAMPPPPAFTPAELKEKLDRLKVIRCHG